MRESRRSMAAALPSRVQTAPRGDGWAAPRMRGAGARRRRRARGAGLKGGGGGAALGLAPPLARAASPSRCFLPRALFCLAPSPLREGVGRHYGGAPLPATPSPSGEGGAQFLPPFTASRCLSLPHPVVWALDAPRSRGLRPSLRTCRSQSCEGAGAAAGV